MGMFDSLYVGCPDCKEEVEFQSKAGECCLGRYNLQDVPLKILIDLDGKSENCPCCHRYIVIRARGLIQGIVE